MYNVHYHLNSLLGETVKCISGDEKYISRAINKELNFEEYKFLLQEVRFIGVTSEFKKVSCRGIGHFRMGTLCRAGRKNCGYDLIWSQWTI